MKEDIAFNKLLVVAKRYSKALEELAESDKDLNVIYENLVSVQNTIKGSDDLTTFIEHPSFSVDVKKEIFSEIFDGKISGDVLNFLFILLDRSRIFALGAIINSLKELMNQKYNIMAVKATSAIELDDKAREQLVKKLEAVCKRKIQLDTEVDESLIAGMVLKIGDKVIDGSVKARLESMKRTLIQR